MGEGRVIVRRKSDDQRLEEVTERAELAERRALVAERTVERCWVILRDLQRRARFVTDRVGSGSSSGFSASLEANTAASWLKFALDGSSSSRELERQQLGQLADAWRQGYSRARIDAERGSVSQNPYSSQETT
jgi:RNA 3'-terminal phosphate cyclase